MSASALAVASVTAVVKGVLENGLAARGVVAALGGDVAVSALPPDRVGMGSDERAQINLFLYLVTPHPTFRGGTLRAGGGERDAGPSLALDLHYLITTYGTQDYHAEILLGYALQLLHETPTLSRDDVTTALAALSDASGGRVVPAPLAALRAFDAGVDAEPLRITPELQSAEDAAKLWSALQAKYRPSAAYKVSTVLINAARADSDVRVGGAVGPPAVRHARRTVS